MKTFCNDSDWNSFVCLQRNFRHIIFRLPSLPLHSSSPPLLSPHSSPPYFVLFSFICLLQVESIINTHKRPVELTFKHAQNFFVKHFSYATLAEADAAIATATAAAWTTFLSFNYSHFCVPLDVYISINCALPSTLSISSSSSFRATLSYTHQHFFYTLCAY